MIVITGATGNVGRPLVDCLFRDGFDVRAVSRNPEQAHLAITFSQWTTDHRAAFAMDRSAAPSEPVSR